MSGKCYCTLGWFEECENPNDPFHKKSLELPEQRIGPVKDNDEVTDPKSTGRKRAVLIKPITEGMICEWANLKYAGGGIFPIIGCPGNLSTNIHHGPDKNTLNNDPTNLHAICSTCHNRWHSRNDGTYPPDKPGDTWLPNGDWKTHNTSVVAEPGEILKHEAYWNLPPNKRKLVNVGDNT